ncbi:uncharacterized protein Bfra_007492 [Botrytis fragariae]|uniref:Uncharacterized protein n=1 Tax=Botrytis fragariae TaxID=1964551 RepID=A0A8H6AJ70_9HELO|nr:uncharacterized protein Bfra_007492 [Botrytis fragariae]KAF5868295.1 hypothetical protein Bfra_007492 [Botrytis fragariae]
MPYGCKLQRDYPCSLAFKTSELCAFWRSSLRPSTKNLSDHSTQANTTKELSAWHDKYGPHNQTNPVLLGGVGLHGYWKDPTTGTYPRALLIMRKILHQDDSRVAGGVSIPTEGLPRRPRKEHKCQTGVMTEVLIGFHPWY